jgi:hypothetical protein
LVLATVIGLPAAANAAAPIAQEPTDDLEVNWSFEASTPTWAGWNSNISYPSVSGAADGVRAALTTCSLSGGCPDGFTIDDPTDPVRSSIAGQTYTGVVWVKGYGTGVGKKATLYLRRVPSAGGNQQVATDFVLTSSWQRVSVALVAGASGDPVDMYVAGREGAAQGEGFYADAASLVASTMPPGNSVSNGSFETGTSGWIGYNAAITNVSPNPSDPPHGRRAAVVTCSNGGVACTNGYSVDDGAATIGSSVAGATYEGSAMVRAGSQSAGQEAGIVVRETNPSTGAEVNRAEQTVVLSSTAYKRVAVTYSATAPGNKIDVYVHRSSASSSTESFLVDAVSSKTSLVPSASRVLNPSFEANLGGWTAYHATMARDTTTPAPDGVGAIKLACINGGSDCADGYSLDDDPASIPSATKGFTYTAKAYVKAVGTPGTRQVGIVVREWDPATNTQVGTNSEQQVTLTSNYQPVSVSRTATATGNELEVIVRRPSGPAGEAFMVDAVSIKPTALPTSPGTCSNLLLSTPASGACARPYEPTASGGTSPFYSRLTAPPTNSRSNATVAWLRGNFGAEPVPLDVGDPRDDYGVPVYRASPADNLYTLHCRSPISTCFDDSHLDGAKIRIPAGAQPAGTAALSDSHDAHMTVVQPTTDRYGQRLVIDLWQVTSIGCTGTNGTPPCDVTFGGSGASNATSHATANGGPSSRGQGAVKAGGIVDQIKLDSYNVNPTNPTTGDEFGAVAAGWGSSLGTIRAQELDNGIIPHALSLVVPCVTGNVAPAHHGDGDCIEKGLEPTGAAAMGDRFRLDITDAEILALDAPEWKMAVLKSLADYGAFVSDNSGDGRRWGFEIESGVQYTSIGQTDPMVTFVNRVGLPGFDPDGNGKLSYRLEEGTGADWSKLRLVTP